MSDGKLSAAEVLSTMSEIGVQLFDTLESHFSVDMDDGRSSTRNNALIHDQQWLHERLNAIITSLESSKSTITEKEQVGSPCCSCKLKVVAWPQISRYHSLIMLSLSVMFGIFYALFQTLML